MIIDTLLSAVVIFFIVIILGIAQIILAVALKENWKDLNEKINCKPSQINFNILKEKVEANEDEFHNTLDKIFKWTVFCNECGCLVKKSMAIKKEEEIESPLSKAFGSIIGVEIPKTKIEVYYCKKCGKTESKPAAKK